MEAGGRAAGPRARVAPRHLPPRAPPRGRAAHPEHAEPDGAHDPVEPGGNGPARHLLRAAHPALRQPAARRADLRLRRGLPHPAPPRPGGTEGRDRRPRHAPGRPAPAPRASASRSLYSLLHEGKWLLLRRPTSARVELPASWSGWTTQLTAEPSREVPGLGAWSSLLVRPDGHLGYVSH
ncbi:hypothetical protein ACN28S_28860 [Cystobacter fuscus]